MPENVANDLRRSTGLDLTGGVRVTKDVGTKEARLYACYLGIFVEPMPDGRRAAQGTMRHVICDEDVANAGVNGTLVTEIS